MNDNPSDLLSTIAKSAASGYGILPLVLIVLFLLYKLRSYRLLGVVMIRDDEVGIVTKKFGTRHLANGRIVAANGEAGFQAPTLSPGLHFGYFPWQFIIHTGKIVTIPAGKVGIVTSIDGEPIPPGRILGRHVDCNLFQDAVAFLTRGGQRGPQADVLPPGDYRLCSHLFKIEEIDAMSIPPNKVAIVTTLDGEPLVSNEIAGREVAGHASFQDAHAFVSNGGRRGLQEQVMKSGMFYVNKRFLTTEIVDMIDVPIGSVGVVISYVGDDGVDQSGDSFTHGNIVERGQRGVWAVPLDPGRYPINTRVMRVEIVPTTNTVLNWITGYKESHGLDASLESIDVRSKDGFSFPIEVSQIIHIAAKNAPKVIARFGTVINLVSQVLEPTIDNYFRNAAQDSEFLAFLSQRSQRQGDAAKFIKAALSVLDVEAVDTLLGDIQPPPSLMETLTQRKIAEEQKTTFATQRMSQIERQTFEQAKSEADTRAQVVQAGRAAEVAKLTAEATVSAAEGQARAKKVNAEADAEVIRVTGNAEAERTKAVGMMEAEVLRSKVAAVGSGNYAAMAVFHDLASNGIRIVPQVAAGGSGSDSNGMVGAMLGAIVGKMQDDVHEEPREEPRRAAE